MSGQASPRPVALTGIKPTGTPHIGNYLGAIRPALGLTQTFEARYFIADVHALNTVRNAEELRKHTLEVAATWLACGLDPEQVLFYRQSDVPQIFELTNFLMAFTAKGLMNRAHAYKDAVQTNIEKERDPDFAVNMGLYTYPVLMAADILLFDTQWVPVGKDQKQHIEMAADIAQCFNHNYNGDWLVIPQPLIGEENQTIVGLDGRKMSKSYDNTIPLFLPPKKLRKTVMRIVTNSQGIEESKDPDKCSVFALYRLFATLEEQNALARRYREGGMGWGEAKEALFVVMDRELTPLRERYEALLAEPQVICDALEEGGRRAREIAERTMGRLRRIMGLVLNP